MTPERWHRIVELAEATSKLDDQSTTAFLEEVCGDDDELRREVEVLMAHEKESRGLFEEPVFRLAGDLIARDQSESRTGQQVGAYCVLRRIGSGGAGEVYLAQDTRLDRKVALKFLAGELTNDQDRILRFRQEARVVSALNHPNILTVYEIGGANSSYYIATEFVSGETLRERMRDRRLSLGEVLDIAIQVANALAAAHAAGIVHRDIKPENIMIRPDGYVKVLDFGLAKLAERPGTMQESYSDHGPPVDTEPGLIMGTPRYMSPEQVRGLSVDTRSDIFSLGIALFEMITGEVPFGGATVSDTIAAVLTKEPPLLAQCGIEAPADLQRIIHRALNKDRSERYQTAEDLLRDLKGLEESLKEEAENCLVLPRRPPHTAQREATAMVNGHSHRPPIGTISFSKVWERLSSSVFELLGRSIAARKIAVLIILSLAGITVLISHFINVRHDESASDIRRIAVLPFALESNNPDSQMISDGLTESLINSLSRLPGLEVVARNSVFRYKGQNPDLQTVATELNVQAVLLGKMIQNSEHLLVTIDLVDARNNTQIWGEQFDETGHNILTVQENIARETSQRLRLKLSREDQRLIGKHYTDSTQAYELYLKGRYYWNKTSEDGLKQAIEYFNQAIGVDPKFALAYAGLAEAYNTLGANYLPPMEVFPLAKGCANKAAELDDTLAEAHYALAMTAYFYDWDWKAAQREFELTLQLNPNHANARDTYGGLLRATGRINEALVEIHRALDLDPLSLRIRLSLGLTYYFARQYDESIKEFRIALHLDPNFFVTYLNIGRPLTALGKFDEAIDVLEKATDLSANNPWALATLGQAYAASGRKSEARRIIKDLQKKAARTYVRPYDQALVYARLGDRDEAIRLLEIAYLERSTWLVVLRLDPGLDSLRSDPRFQDLLERMGLQG
jgi:serine/threonine-protein kinase